MYAVVTINGKQWRVAKGDRIRVDLLGGSLTEPPAAWKPGASVSFNEVLLTAGEGAVKVGQPTLKGASVTATVTQHGRGTKLWAFKRKRRKGFHKTIGHRQPFTELEITGINA